jgi:hypothetical protein
VVLFIMFRRIGRTRKVRVNRIWVTPAIIAAATGYALYASGFPSFLWLLGYILAAGAGITVGYYRSRHMHLSVNLGTGDVQATQTPLATYILMGLFIAKLGMNYLFPELNGGQSSTSIGSLFVPDTVDAVQTAQQVSHGTAAAINYGTDAGLLFSAAMFVTGAIETWTRAHRLLADHRGEKGDFMI